MLSSCRRAVNAAAAPVPAAGALPTSPDSELPGEQKDGDDDAVGDDADP